MALFSSRIAIISHIRLIDRELLNTFREMRRLRLAKKAGWRRAVVDLMDDVDRMTVLRRQCETMVGSTIEEGNGRISTGPTATLTEPI